MNEDEVDRRLHSLFGPAGHSRAGPELLRHASDALRPSRAFPGSADLDPRPQWVVWPERVDQVQQLVSLANELLVPLVPFGGGTGLMGGALPAHGGIVVDLTRLNRVLSIKPEDRTATVQAGVVLKELESRLNAEGFMLGHDPWTVPVATVGGAISTNGLGYRGAQYGSMGEQVLGLEAVLPDGSLVKTRAVPKASTGLALQQLFIGTEGCFGIITAARVKVFPLPEHRSIHALSFPGFEAGFGVVCEMFSLGLVPALLEFGEDFDTPSEGRDGAELYLGFEGLKEVVEAQERRALALCDAGGGTLLDASVGKRFWKQRHASAERFVRQREQAGSAPFLQPVEGPLVDYLHVALPASQVLSYRRRCLDIAQETGVQVRDCGLWNRPELFSLVLLDTAAVPGRLTQTVDRVLTLAQDLGGAMEYCHGVGLRLAHLMGREHGVGLQLLRQLKRSLDPRHILNPGKLAL